jgi:hypothetical protein
MGRTQRNRTYRHNRPRTPYHPSGLERKMENQMTDPTSQVQGRGLGTKTKLRAPKRRIGAVKDPLDLVLRSQRSVGPTLTPLPLPVHATRHNHNHHLQTHTRWLKPRIGDINRG